MPALSGSWNSKNGKDLSQGAILTRPGIDTDNLVRIDSIGIVFYDANDDWKIDPSDTVIGSLVYSSALAKVQGIFTQDKNTPTSFLFGASKSDQTKGLLVIFNEKYLSGQSLKPPPPITPDTTKPLPSKLKTDLEATLKNPNSIKNFIAQNLSPVSTVTSSSPVDLSSSTQKDIVLDGLSNISANGNSLDNNLVGNPGNNTLDGGEGNDILIGGAGDDLYVVDSVFDTVVELSEEGFDTVKSFVNYILPKNVENLILSGILSISGSGNELNNSIIGNDGNNFLYGFAGDDTLDGKSGNDSLFGGVGNDIYYVDSLNDKIFENSNEGDDKVFILIRESAEYRIPDNIERATLDPIATVFLSGNKLSNDISGNDFDNILYGDPFSVKNGMVISSIIGGDDHILAAGGNDTIYGLNGNDYLDGGTGMDTMYGGLGNDICIVDDTNDQVIERAAEGQDQVISYISYTLPNNVEALKLTGNANTTGIGNTLNNVIIGNNGNNIIDGKEGTDILTGLAGSDTFAFSTKPSSFNQSSADRITDFNPDDDFISINSSVFNINNAIALKFQSVEGTAALSLAMKNNNDFIYDKSTGYLYWDQNGLLDGAGTGGIIAILGKGSNVTVFPSLSSSNFIIS